MYFGNNPTQLRIWKGLDGSFKPEFVKAILEEDNHQHNSTRQQRSRCQFACSVACSVACNHQPPSLATAAHVTPSLLLQKHTRIMKGRWCRIDELPVCFMTINC
ncbi:hypothetical protein L6452_01513 [Arctium lappa]|uniref:Uncharacterized protein n=1 Tax=Arctium lappa TaxID=4217 RepID=A0ACB9FIC5_ARCLA|nr:hypothetical protein L6452_01513 [Arctium lappa]